MAYFTPGATRNPLGGYNRLGSGGGSSGDVTVPTDYWKLAGTTSEADSIAGGFLLDKGGGNYPGNATTSPFGHERVWTSGGAQYLFDQTGGQANLKAGSGAWTLTCWFKPADQTGFQVLVEFSNFSSRGIEIQNNAGTLTIQTYDGVHNSGENWSGSLTNGTWYFIATRYDGGSAGSAKLEISVNGGAWSTLSSAFPQTNITTDTFYVGGNSNKIIGSLCRVGWWKGTALSDAQIATLYNGGLGADPPLA